LSRSGPSCGVNNSIGPRAFANEISQTDDAGDSGIRNIANHCLEGRKISMQVRDQRNTLHLINLTLQIARLQLSQNIGGAFSHSF
jgi:hypothetical protein